MKKFLIYNWLCLCAGLKSRYKWLIIFYIIWIYRVEFVPADDAGFAKILQVLSTFAMLLLAISYKKNILKKISSIKLLALRSLLVLYLYATITAFFSVMPQFAFFLAFQNVVVIIVLFWFFSLFKDFVSIERSLLVLATLQMVAESLLYRVLNEPYFIVHFLGGGSMAALLISYCTGELLSMRIKDGMRRTLLKNILYLSVFIIIISTSSGANASAVFGVSVALFFSGKALYAFCLIVLLIVLYFNKEWITMLIQFIMPGKSWESIETATGRDRLWEVMLDLAKQKPWFGWGFGCIERVASETGRTGFSVPDAHNNYVGFYGSLGYVGSAIAYLHLASSWLYSFKNRMKPGFVGLLSAISCAILNGYSYAFLASKACSITIAYFAMIIALYYYSKTNVYDITRVEQ